MGHSVGARVDRIALLGAPTVMGCRAPGRWRPTRSHARLDACEGDALVAVEHREEARHAELVRDRGELGEGPLPAGRARLPRRGRRSERRARAAGGVARHEPGSSRVRSSRYAIDRWTSSRRASSSIESGSRASARTRGSGCRGSASATGGRCGSSSGAGGTGIRLLKVSSCAVDRTSLRSVQ